MDDWIDEYAGTEAQECETRLLLDDGRCDRDVIGGEQPYIDHHREKARGRWTDG